MKNYEVLTNGVEVVYAFGDVPQKASKKFVFLAGTTAWRGDLQKDSWRRYFIEKIANETALPKNIVFCIPEPQFGVFTGNHSRHLIEWETEYLDRSAIHAYWLNTYWEYEAAIEGTSKDSAKYFSDGSEANIGITVRSELGASFARYKHSPTDFEVVVGAPHDAQGLAWLAIQSRLLGIPVYRLMDKYEVFSEDWYRAVLYELGRI